MPDLTPLINETLSKEVQSLLYLLGSWGEKHTFHIFAAGEFVFNLLNRRETRKIELVVVESAVEFGESLKKLLPGRLDSNEKSGTAKLQLPGHVYLNMVSAPKDFFYNFTEKGDSIENALKNELFKRDFTILTMACALNPYSYGKLFDFFGGNKDFEKGIIRSLYKLSFVDKPERILEAVLLEQRLGYTIEKDTFLNLNSAIKKKMLGRLSREQINEKIRITLNEPSPAGILDRLRELQSFDRLFPRISYTVELKSRLLKMESILKKIAGSNFTGEYNSFLVYLSALFYKLSTHDFKYLSYLLRLKKEEYQALCSIIQNSQVILDKMRTGVSSCLFCTDIKKYFKESMILAYTFSDNHNLWEEHIVNYIETSIK